MITKEIKSLQHSNVKHWVKLRKHPKYRLSSHSVFIEGKKLIQELGRKKRIKKLIVKIGQPIPPSIVYDELYLVTEEILAKISGVVAPEPIAAEISFPEEVSLNGKKLLLGLDTINDPGNLGTLFRTAFALGFEGIFLTPMCADPFNEKAIRAAKGATFFLPFQRGTFDDLKLLIKQNHLHSYIGDMEGEAIDSIAFQFPLILILGNEAHGVSEAAKDLSSSVSIPISDEMESLNVAVAGGILMQKIREQVRKNGKQ